jgi:hypothetical protein
MKKGVFPDRETSLLVMKEEKNSVPGFDADTVKDLQTENKMRIIYRNGFEKQA